jgi:hypothetical protein
MAENAKQCPWCERWFLKDSNCNYIFACGLNSNNIFEIGHGCGKSWCWECGKKFCGKYYDECAGKKISTRTNHDSKCCINDKNFTIKEEYCCGGHNSHCEKRW